MTKKILKSLKKMDFTQGYQLKKSPTQYQKALGKTTIIMNQIPYAETQYRTILIKERMKGEKLTSTLACVQILDNITWRMIPNEAYRRKQKVKNKTLKVSDLPVLPKNIDDYLFDNVFPSFPYHSLVAQLFPRVENYLNQ